MRLLREILFVLLAAGAGVIFIIVAFVATSIALGHDAGGWEMAFGMLVIMTFWPFVGTTAVARFLSLLFRRGESWRSSVAIALALTGTLLALLELAFTPNRNMGSAIYIGFALLGAAVSALSVTLLNNAADRHARH